MNEIQKSAAAISLTLACGMLMAAGIPAKAWFSAPEERMVQSFAKTDREGHILTFDRTEFTGRVSGKEKLASIVVASLPEQGELCLSGVPVRQGEAISTDRLSSLCFVPELGQEVHTGFTFVPVFAQSGAEKQEARVSLNLSDVPNTAPIAVEQSLETYTDLPLHGSLKAIDPDGDPCTFTVLRQGRKGTAEVTETGFCYTPEGKSGRDSFSVVASDCYGNRSAPAEIEVRVRKRAEKEVFTYTDLAQSTAHYAALRLREEGIFSGECFGEEAFFCPDQPVTRAEFLTMAASVADLAQPTGAVGTGLADHDDIPVWAQSYVAVGLLSGVIHGSEDGLGNRVFQAEQQITRGEAASILDRCLQLPDDGRRMTFADSDAVPDWAEQSVVNAAAAGILPAFDDGTVRCEAFVTREDAAVMLYQMLRSTQN